MLYDLTTPFRENKCISLSLGGTIIPGWPGLVLVITFVETRITSVFGTNSGVIPLQFQPECGFAMTVWAGTKPLPGCRNDLPSLHSHSDLNSLHNEPSLVLVCCLDRFSPLLATFSQKIPITAIFLSSLFVIFLDWIFLSPD